MIEKVIKKTQNATTTISTGAGAIGGGAAGYAVTMATAGFFTKIGFAIGIIAPPLAPIAIGAIVGGTALYGLSKTAKKANSVESKINYIFTQQGFSDGPQ